MDAFLKEVYMMEFKDAPRYSKLKEILQENYNATQKQPTKGEPFFISTETVDTEFKVPSGLPKKRNRTDVSGTLVPIARRSTADTSVLGKQESQDMIEEEALPLEEPYKKKALRPNRTDSS